MKKLVVVAGVLICLFLAWLLTGEVEEVDRTRVEPATVETWYDRLSAARHARARWRARIVNLRWQLARADAEVQRCLLRGSGALPDACLEEMEHRREIAADYIITVADAAIETQRAFCPTCDREVRAAATEARRAVTNTLDGIEAGACSALCPEPRTGRPVASFCVHTCPNLNRRPASMLEAEGQQTKQHSGERSW